jgi:hypothetical protein
MVTKEDERGVIRHEARAKQLFIFKNLRYGNITPTDVDGLIEYQNKAYIIFEIKYGYAKMPLGQRIALERLQRDLSLSGKASVLFVAQHEIKDTSENVDVSKAVVRQYYFEDKWRVPAIETTLGEAIDEFIDTVNGVKAKKIKKIEEIEEIAEMKEA